MRMAGGVPMTGPAFDRLVAALEAHSRQVRTVGPGRVRSSCPAHDGDNLSALSVMDSVDRVNTFCHTGGCDTKAVLESLGLTVRDRYHEPRGDALAVYAYPNGRAVTRKLGTGGDGKDFRQRNGQVPAVLYRDPVGAVAEGRTVYLVEGEEDVHAIEAAGQFATSAPQGAGSFGKVDVEPLRGADVVAIVDRDERGDQWAATVRERVGPVAQRLAFAQAAAGKDAADHLTAGHPLDALEPYSAPQDTGDPEAELIDHLALEEYRKLRAREAARARLAAEKAEAAEPFDLDTLQAVLDRPAPPAGRVPGLIPWEASTLVVAQRKTGKTTLLVNLARCLLTGERFLDRFDVTPIAQAGTVALLNYEVSAHTVARWADDAGVPTDRLILVNLRGRRNPLGNEHDRTALADELRARHVESILVDPFSGAYTGDSQNDAGQVGAWLADLDRFARSQVGARDLLLAAHAGWNGERTRGTSALEDWADVIINLTRDDADNRYLRAMGRDVDIEEDRLEFDADTRQLRLTGDGSRKHAVAAQSNFETESNILEYLSQHRDGLSGNELAGISGRKDGSFTKARDSLVADGRVAQVRRSGRGGGWLYTLSANLPNLPKPTESAPNEPTEPPLIGGGSGSVSTEPQPPEGQVAPKCPTCGGSNHPDRDLLGYVCLRCHEAGVRPDTREGIAP